MALVKKIALALKYFVTNTFCDVRQPSEIHFRFKSDNLFYKISSPKCSVLLTLSAGTDESCPVQKLTLVVCSEGLQQGTRGLLGIPHTIWTYFVTLFSRLYHSPWYIHLNRLISHIRQHTCSKCQHTPFRTGMETWIVEYGTDTLWTLLIRSFVYWLLETG